MLKTQYYLIKVQLKEIEPTIWRRFVVDKNISLDVFEQAMRLGFGWYGSYLGVFESHGVYYVNRTHNRQNLRKEKINQPTRNCRDFHLDDILNTNNPSIDYIYDFNKDKWEHFILLENENYQSDPTPYSVHCIDGENNCPIENIGGVKNYQDFLQVIQNPQHPDFNQAYKWLDKQGLNIECIEPTQFYLNFANRMISKVFN